MAMTQEPAESLVATVKLDLQTPSTTSDSTLNLLRALLGLDLVDRSRSAAIETKPKKTTRAPTKTSVRLPGRQASTHRTKAIPNFKIHDGTSTATQPLPQERRRALATETFNITLKQLSSEVKERQTAGKAQPVATPRTSPQKVLQTRSPNRKALPAAKEKAGYASKGARTMVGREAHLQATADCAMASLKSLDQLAQDTNLAASDASDALIRAAQILLDKFLGLGLKEQAEEQLWQVRKQLCVRMGESTRSTQGKTSISKAMTFDTICTDAKVLGMVTSFQLQVLKIGNLIGAGFVDQDLLQALDSSSSSNPVAICTKAIKSGIMTEEKAGQHLHGLSMTLSRICSAIRGKHHRALSTFEKFQLNIAMLTIRCHSWKMLGHKADVERELWTPLSRALQDYSETCDASNSADLGPMKTTILEMQSLLAGVGYRQPLPPTVTNMLVEVAQRCGSTEQALEFLGDQLAVGEKSAGIVAAVNRCRASTIVMGDAASTVSARLAACDMALSSLTTPLKGTASELRELLLYSARLRKAVTAAVLHMEKLIKSTQVDEDELSLQACSMRLLYAILRFVLRYTSQIKASDKIHDDAHEQLELPPAVSNCARNTIDSVLSIMKSESVRSTLLWNETERVLKECLELTNLLGESTSNELGKVPPSAHLRISNMYWAWYLHDKDAKVGTQQLCCLLERSVEALTSCVVQERVLAFEVVKFERLASCYQILREFGKAKATLVCAIQAAVAHGALKEAVDIALTKPARTAWTDTRLNAHMLGSCLRKLVRASVEHSTQPSVEEMAFFDDDPLPEIHRAQLLEVQLLATADLPITASTKTICTSLAKQILGLCQQPQYHVYRIRFIRDMLSLATKYTQFPIHEVLDDELIQTACTFREPHSAAPCFLMSYGPLLCLSVLLYWAFLTTRPSSDCLQGLIDSTTSLLSQCQSPTELEAAVDDPESLLRQLFAVADYAGMLDWPNVRLNALQAMRQVLQNRKFVDATQLAGCLTDIGSVTARLGDTSAAGRSFAEAEKLLDSSDGVIETRLSWCLAYSNYLINLKAYEKGAKMVEAAQIIYHELLKQPNRRERGSEKLKLESQLSQATLAASKLAFHQGDLRSAIAYARQCAKLTSGIWGALEKLFDVIRDHLEATGIDLTQISTEDPSNTTFSLDHSSLQTVINGAPFWTHIDIHFQALMHMSYLSAHCGLYTDAVYYANLASKISTLLTSEQRQVACCVRLALLHAKAGQDADARLRINAVRTGSFILLPGLEASSLSLDLATAAFCLDDLDASEQYLEKARVALSKVRLPISSDAPIGHSPAVTLEKQMKGLTITESEAAGGTKPRRTRATHRTVPVSLKSTRKPGVLQPGPSGAPKTKPVSPAVTQLREDQATLELQIRIRKGKSQGQVETPENELALIKPSASDKRKLVQATILLNEALARFGSDAVHCVLAETALAYPSRYTARRPSGRVSAVSATTVSVQAKVSTRPRQGQKKSNDAADMDAGSPETLLRGAYELLAVASATNTARSSSDIVHDVQKLFCRLSMLANAVGLGLSYSPTKVLTDSLKPKDTMLLRERFVLDTDQLNFDKSDLRKWPTMLKGGDPLPTESSSGNVYAETANFDELPETWSVVSMSLNDAKTEMLLSRATSETTPLILRIPLSRSTIDDGEEGQFTFQEAKEELVDIIENANATAHDSRSQAEKTARKAWWAERESLDRRLETLLLNMENIWLGGFRGILSQQRNSDEEMLSKFSSSVDAALEKQLPSRQKTGATSTKKVRLHAHVLDLFIALGHPDENQLDDAITDLLYFVVDILQFEGERNAYDEIDFDAILVDVLDALRSYHDSCPKDTTARHTILILDKELHLFPWESLPCLLGRSVSRMPSMGMIHDRLARIRAQSANNEAYNIPASSGGYILNPSSDLPSTESTFSEVFTKQLPTFTSIISRKPTESEFESLLLDNALLLYFGHGSGAQYIRGRRIKQLDNCAVTFLMGCSSGKMTECGDFESYGVPWNYMHAGSMAVVGTLWDVTDRDIDRFALAAFEEWGLLENVAEDEKARKKTEARKRKAGGGKKKQITGRKGRGMVALDEAVNRAKDACVLRYLNGAAVVMYGLPVMLE
jgi:separase